MGGLWLCNREEIGMDLRPLTLLGMATALGIGALALAQVTPEKPKPKEGGDLAAAKAAPQPAEGPLLEARGFVAELANELYRVREDATKRLWDLGEVGIKALKEGVESDDPEVAHRSRILLQRIRTGITPTTPPEIVELVQRYFRSGINGKKKAFQELSEKKAYIQMFRLYRFEGDVAAREACDEVLNKSVLPAALGELVEDRVGEAEKLLRLAPANDANLRRLAALLRVKGRLDDELRKTEEELKRNPDGSLSREALKSDAAALHLALLRANGNATEARELAEKMKREDLVAGLALFEGDPIPYLNWFMNQQGKSPVVRIHAEAVLKRWQGDEEGARKLMNNVAKEAREGGDEQREALLSLLLNGYTDLAIPIVVRDNKDSAFGYFETTELPLKAVASVGYAGSAEEKKKWLDDHLGELRENWNDSQATRYDVLTVCSFLHTRGEREDARRMMLALSEIAAKEGDTTWLELVGRLNDLGGSLYELAFVIAAERLGKKDEKEEAPKVIAALFGEGDSARRLWDCLEALEKGQASERVLLLGAIFGAVYLEGEKLQAVLKALRDQAGEAKPDDRVPMLSDLLEAAESRDDAGAALELLEQLAKIGEGGAWVKKLASYYSYVSDWDLALEKLDAILKAEPRNLHYLALYGGAKIRNGKPEDAVEALRLVELFALDEPIRLLRLAIDLERSGAIAEAEKSWRQLLVANPPKDWYWQSATSYFAKHARLKKQWRVAAAFAEVDAMQYIKGRSTFINPVTYIRKRFAADLYRGLALLEEGDEPEAMKLFRRSFELLNGDGMLADDYFPLLREAGVTDEHDRNFKIVYQRLEESIKVFPKAHNTYNSAAWMASRASRRLDDAHDKIRTALSMRPRQAAYLDTMAEVWFAKKNREEAVKWSSKAVRDSFHGGYSGADGGVGLREQYDRFRSGEFPVP